MGHKTKFKIEFGDEMNDNSINQEDSYTKEYEDSLSDGEDSLSEKNEDFSNDDENDDDDEDEIYRNQNSKRFLRAVGKFFRRIIPKPKFEFKPFWRVCSGGDDKKCYISIDNIIPEPGDHEPGKYVDEARTTGRKYLTRRGNQAKSFSDSLIQSCKGR